MFQWNLRTEAHCGTMSLLEDEEMITEEEYLDDPIQLIPQSGESDNLTNYPEPAEFTAYKQHSYVPVTFFNIERNIKLLNNCRPLCIKLVDCNKYPWYNKKNNKQYGQECNNLQTYDSDTSDDSDIMYSENDTETLSITAKSILKKISSNGLMIKVKKYKNKRDKKIKGVDYKKNKGLIGMKITPTFEVIVIDDESDDSRKAYVNKEKEKSDDVTAEVNENFTDTPQFDWTIEKSKKSESEAGSTVGFNPREKTEAIKDITEATYSDLSHDSRVIDDVEKVVLETSEINDVQISTNIKLTGNTIINNKKEGTMELKDKVDALRKEGKCEELIREVSCSLTLENTHETSTESTVKPTTIVKNDDRSLSIHSDTINSETLVKEDDCLKSPVFPCTPPKKIKRFTKDRHDTSKLVIHHPKDFNDNKFKPNRLSSPKARSQVLAEKAKFIQDGATECIKTTKSISQNHKQILGLNPNEKRIDIQNENDVNFRTASQQVNTGELNLEASSNQNKNDHEITSNIGTGGQNNFQNLTIHESKNDKYCTDAPVSTSNGQTLHKQKIIKLKLDENIYKEVIEKQKSLQVNNRNEAQKNNDFYVTSKVSSQANKADDFLTSKVSYLDQNYMKRPPVSIAENRPSSSHTIDTILDKSKPEDTSRIVSKKVHIFQKIGSAVFQENNISQGNAHKTPHILSKSRIRPFTGSISNWQNMNNESLRTNNFSKIADPISKNLYLGTSQLHHQPHIMAQNIVSTPTQKSQQSTGTITQTDHRESSAQNDAIIQGRNVSNNLQNSTVSRNDGSKNVMQNADFIAEQKKANVSPNYISRHKPQNCCFPSFGPQPRQFVRPIMRQDGTQVLSVSNYPRRMYSNTMNINSVPVNPYVGYSNTYNTYWPYQYTSMPPPPPPPAPPISNSVVPNISQAYGKLNAPDKTKVNVIKQINFVARPVPENLRDNNVTDRPNLIDINLNSTNYPKSLNSIDVNNSQNVVSSKTEMFEELEKEMMNIHHEDSENFINNQLCDRRPIDKHNNAKSDPRIKPSLNVTQTLKKKVAIQSTNKGNTIFIKPHREVHDTKKQSRNTVLAFKRPSSEIISKDIVKKKKNVISTPTPHKLDKNNAVVGDSSARGYSQPILPIPTFKQTLDILTRASNDAQKRLEAFDKSRKQSSMKEDNTKNVNSNLKKDKVKKISLDEYKKREDKRVCERKKQKYERKKKDEMAKKCVETKHSDQDQGYDSDSTIVL